MSVQVNWWVTGIMIFVVIAALAVVISLIIRTYSQKTATGKENLIGQIALVKERLNPEGVVAVEGELWDAVSQSGSMEAGQEVIILAVKGLTLLVEKNTKE
jgi:membrane-bound serine protease (ClpP class)